jgi:hypothetical protein
MILVNLMRGPVTIKSSTIVEKIGRGGLASPRMVHRCVDDDRSPCGNRRRSHGAHISLTAFGIDSLIELASAGVLIWRLSVELKHSRAFSEHAERTASRIAGGLWFALAASIVAAAASGLWYRVAAKNSRKRRAACSPAAAIATGTARLPEIDATVRDLVLATSSFMADGVT